MNKDIIYSLTVLVIVVGKDSHIKGLINNANRCLDCSAIDYDVTDRLNALLHKYDIIMELSGAKQSILHRSNVTMTSLWSKVECLSMIIVLDSSLILYIYNVM